MNDVLSDILDTVHLAGTLYFRTSFSPPFAIQVPAYQQAARFHLVVRGRCNVTFASGRMVELHAGDMVLIPKGHTHTLADQAGQPGAPLEQVIEASGYTGKGIFVVGTEDPDAATQLVCGHFSFRDGADHPLLRALPEFIVTSVEERARLPLLDEMLRLIARKVFADDLGTRAAVVRLSEIVFIELLNAGVADAPELQNLTVALKDKHIGRALALIHAEPERAWSVEKLASEIGMSRSRFADRFRDLIGCGVMSYVSDWRLQKALAMLGEAKWSVQEVAARSGYRSPAVFTRAFSAKFGTPPTKYRLGGLQRVKKHDLRQA